MTTIPLADAKARLSAVLDEVRDTHERVVITRNGRPEAVIMSVSDLEALEETLDLLSTPGDDRGATCGTASGCGSGRRSVHHGSAAGKAGCGRQAADQRADRLPLRPTGRLPGDLPHRRPGPDR
ncbi:MAG TPA: type II toxin-antitoxin system Phd/YefM family antitoxin, partial [Streptosporangiaceae bacterium]|nr:type II toxin-antitoxin system Phd/YefM family antitoxin [Streptosporangiaceae bacterium]